MKLFSINNGSTGVATEGILYTCPNCKTEEYIPEEVVQSRYMWIIDKDRVMECSACGCHYNGGDEEVIVNTFDN